MRLLLSWSDWHEGRSQSGDLGPIRRLLSVGEGSYDEVRLLCARRDRHAAHALAVELTHAGQAASFRSLDVSDPSDHQQLFNALMPVVRGLPAGADVDVLLSSGTPQAQTVWVLLVKAGLLPARMLQVIPPRFVPDPHPEPVREVRLDFDGFPEIRALREEVVRLRAESRRLATGLVGESPPMQQLAERVLRVARSRVPVLVCGETGTGKELVARAVHNAGPRSGGPFVAENCGTFAEGVLASELFGHEAGAFTGAQKRHKGLFEQAEGGTLFLDEVGELSLRVQVQLLRVLQEGVIRRVGGEESVPVDVRVIAATHRDLPSLVASGAFREDLYYRLNGATLAVPPLRERPADLEPLVVHFLAASGGALRITRSAWAALRAYPWPGNVRELRAEVERWSVFCDQQVELADLSAPIQAAWTASSGGAPAPVQSAAASVGAPAGLPVERLDALIARTEEQAVRAALSESGGNLSEASRLLGVDRNTLKRKMSAFSLR